MIARVLMRALPILWAAIAGCGGGVTSARVELPPARPQAARALVAGARLAKAGTPANLRRARARFERAIDIDSNLWEAHYNLGVLARRQGNLTEAIEHFEQAQSIQSGAPEPIMALAEARYYAGQRRGASRLLYAYLDAHPEAVEARVALTTILRERGEHRRALAQAREVLVRDSRNVSALAEIGRIYRAQGEHDVADLVFRKALAIDADSAVLHNDLGLLALARGDTQAAFNEFARSIELDPAFAPARLNQGSVLLQAGDYAGAQSEYEAALRGDPDNYDARVAVGVCLRGLGQHQRARRELERVLAARPNDPAALFNLAVLRAEFLNQRTRSRELFQRFLSVTSSGVPEREMAQRYLREIPAPNSRRR